TAAPTLVQAGLYDAAGRRAIAVYDDYARPTSTGRQTITLRFFGKLFADARVDGPYRLRALHGFVKQPGQYPAEVFWDAPDEPPAMTAFHRATEFSGADWSDPALHEKLARYEQYVRDMSTSRR